MLVYRFQDIHGKGPSMISLPYKIDQIFSKLSSPQAEGLTHWRDRNLPEEKMSLRFAFACKHYADSVMQNWYGTFTDYGIYLYEIEIDPEFVQIGLIGDQVVFDSNFIISIKKLEYSNEYQIS